MPIRVVPLQSRRRERAALLQKLQHVVPAATLLGQGLARLLHEPHGWSLALGAAELVISVVVVVAFGRQARTTWRGGHAPHGDPGAGHAIDWVDVCLGVMLGVEVWAHWYETGHVKRPTVTLAVGMIVIGLLHGRIAAGGTRRRTLRVDEAGIDVGGRLFRRFRATWDQLAGIDIGSDRARLVRRDGRVRTIDLRDLHHSGEVRAALEEARLRLRPPAQPEPSPDAPAVPAGRSSS